MTEYCPECGTKSTGALYCGTCGTKITDEIPPQEFTTQSQRPSYVEQKEVVNNQFFPKVKHNNVKTKNYYRVKTPLLQIVTVLQWIAVVLLAIGTILSLIILFPIGIIVGLFLWLQYWIARGLTDLNNNARIVALVLAAIGVISYVFGLFMGDASGFLGFLISVFTVYTLGMHQPTIKLFWDKSKLRIQNKAYVPY